MQLSSRKKLLRVILISGILLLLYAVYYARQLAPIGQVYTAKVLCSGVFLSKRDPGSVLHEELEGLASIMSAAVDTRDRSTAVSMPGLPLQRAQYWDGFGCTVLPEGSDKFLLKPVIIDHETPRRSSRSLSVEAPSGRLLGVLDRAFSESGESRAKRTRAVVIVHKGRIIAERYAAGFSADTPLPGWSMTKSVTNALVGILVKQGKLAIDRPAPVAEWSGAGDPRSAVTLDHLLHMSSGLEFDERAGPFLSDVNTMLLLSPDAGAYAVSKPLSHVPGMRWQYSSGTSNILSRIIRDRAGGTDASYHAFPRRELFQKIGMQSAVMEVDASGTFVGSSFMYATARDWARFGMLYLQDGIWEGERILPEGWVSYSAASAPAAPKGKYGAHFWTNGTAGAPERDRPFPRLPADMFYASGYEGQCVVIVPSRELVVVRLGLTKNPMAWSMEDLIAEVIEAL